MTRCGMYSPPVPEWDVPFPDGDEQKTKKTKKHIPANEGYTFGVKCRKMAKDKLEKALKKRYAAACSPLPRRSVADSSASRQRITAIMHTELTLS